MVITIIDRRHLGKNMRVYRRAVLCYNNACNIGHGDNGFRFFFLFYYFVSNLIERRRMTIRARCAMTHALPARGKTRPSRRIRFA